MPKSKTKQNKQKNSKDKEENDTQEMPDFNKAPDKVPDEFYKIIKDFTEDIVTTFPEYKSIIDKWWGTSSNIDDPEKILEDKNDKTEFVFAHCLRVIPERFFDILYQNDSMFAQDSNVNTEFLPGIVFKYLWSCDISDSTRETIWKYLQLILFSLLNSVKSSKDFGDSAKLFEAINEEELKSKLEETVNHMQNMFENGNGDGNTSSSSSSSENGGGINMENMPSAESMHEHIQEMMKGNLGKLAMELAEEAAQDLNLDMENVSSANDAFKQMFKNPSKLMNIVKNLGSKLDAKIKSGEIKESELISEGMEMLNKMKSMPGMGNMQEMFAKMGMPGMPTGKGKVNVSAMESQMQKNFKMAQMKERMRKKAEDNNKSTTATTSAQTASSAAPALTDEQLISVFSKGEKSEKTPRGAKAPLANTTSKESTKTSEPKIEKEKKKKN